MLLEFDADQRLWQDTVRDVVTKQCPPSLVRSVAEDGADAEPALEGLSCDLGWTELNDPASAVELAIVLEELGHATDPTPFLATMSQFAPLAPAPVRPGPVGHRRVQGGFGATATPTAGCWTAPRVMFSTAIVSIGWRW